MMWTKRGKNGDARSFIGVLTTTGGSIAQTKKYMVFETTP